MPFNRPSLADLADRIKADIDSRWPGAESRLPASNLAVMARVNAGVAHGLYAHQDYISRQVLPDSADGDHLDRHAGIWGVTRKPAAFATGAVMLTGADGTVLPAGLHLIRRDGREYLTTAETVIAGGAAMVVVAADLPGLGGNAGGGVQLSLASPVAGVQSQGLVGPAGVSGGADAEDDASLLARLLDRIQEPPHGGAAFDYVKQALAQPGVTRAWAYPLELGIGTVTVRIMMDGTYPDGIPAADDVARVQAALDITRPVTADLTVVAPIPMPMALTISGLAPALESVRAAVAAEIADLIRRQAVPGGIILLSHIREAISIAEGEHDHVLAAPDADVTHATGEIAVPGLIEWI